MGRQLSENRCRIRDALRVFETENLHTLDGNDLSSRARVPVQILARFVRDDLNAGLLQMGPILLTIEQDGRSAESIWESAIRLNQYPMWWNASRVFHEPVYFRLTYHRFEKLLGRFGLKQMVERRNKLIVVKDLSDACPALAEKLKPSRLALKSIAALPAQTEVNL